MNNLAIHVSDIHILNTSKFEEQKEVFLNLIEITKKIKPRFVAICGDLFHSQLILSPESYFLARFLIHELSNITKVIIVPGNHDLNLNNLKRMDGISSFIDELDPEKVFYYKNSGIYEFEDDIIIGSFSIADKNYPECPDTKKKKIALYHGTIAGSSNHFGFKFENAKDTIKIFDGWDIAMLGDIHKMQYMDSNKRIAYSGSLRQMDYGESIDKGILVWDLDSFKSTFVKIKNNCSYQKLFSENEIDSAIFTKNVNLTFVSNEKLSDAKKIDIQKKIFDRASKLNSNILSYKYEDLSKEDIMSSVDRDIENIYDLNVQLDLLKEYLEQYKYKKNIIDEILELHTNIFNQIITKEFKLSSWFIEKIDFENMLIFKGKNSIDFTSLNGLIGIFGQNMNGKSSLFSIIKYAIWGETTSKVDVDKILNHFSNSGKTEIIVNVDNVRYKIKRTIQKSDNNVISTSVSVDNLSDPDDLECKGGKNELKKFIPKKLGSVQNFHDTSFSSQFQIQSLIFTKPAPRKQLLLNFLGLDIFSNFLKPIKKKHSELEYKIKNFSKDRILIEYKKINEEILESNPILEKKLIDLTDLNNQISQDEDSLIELKSKIEKLDSNIPNDSIAVLETKIENLSNNIIDNEKILGCFIEQTFKNDPILLNDKIVEQKNEISKIDLKINKIKSEIINHNNKKTNLDNKINESKSNSKIIDEQDWCRTSDICKKCMFLSNAFETENNVPTLLKELSNVSEIIKLLEDRLKLEIDSKNNVYTFLMENEEELKTINKYEKDYQNFLLIKEKNKNLEFQISELKRVILLINENQKKISNNKEIEIQITNLQLQLEKKKSDKLSLQNLINNLKINLKFNSERLKEINTQLEDIKNDEHQFELYNIYSFAMDRDGLPKLIMMKYIDIVNIKANHVLNEVVDWKILLVPNGENLEIMIQEQSGLEYCADQLGSGMQVTIVGLAIRVALLGISQITKSKILFLDEVLGPLDIDMVKKIENVFFYLKSIFKSILMISHVNIHDVCDHVILLEREDNSTKLIIN